LALLVSIYTVYENGTVASVRVHEDRLKMEALKSGAIELTAHRQLRLPSPSRPTRGHFSFQLDHADIDVDFQSEAARIDLNAAPKQLLTGLFLQLGARSDDAERYSDRVVAWRMAPETSDMSALPSSNPRQLGFTHTSELALVPTLPIAIVERALPYVTVYSGLPQVNVFDAAPEIINALPEMTPERARTLLMQRQGSVDLKSLGPLLGAAEQFVTNEGSRALRVSVRVALDNASASTSEAVILLFDSGSEPYSILSWHDEAHSQYAAFRSSGGNAR
jgi:general secretion pathway protein K